MLGLGLPALAVWQALKGWLPSRLFAAGEKGGLWDFSTLANLYQDSAGTTPCTAVGDPIGLVLDTKNGTPQLGPELVTNGDFSQGSTGWGLGATTAIVNNAAVSTATPSGSNILQQSGLQPGAQKFVRISFDISGWSGGNLRIFINDNVYGLTGSNGAKSFILLSTGSTGSGLLIRAESSNFTGTIDNISVRELPGNHLSQSTSTKRPTLGRMPATGVRNQLTYTDNAYDTRSGWSPGSGCTVTNDALIQSGVTLSSVVPTTSTSTKGTYLGVAPGVFSFYVKANGYRYAQLYDAGSATLGSLVFDAVAGVFSLNSLNIPVSVTSLGGGLFRVSVAVASQMSLGVGVCISGTPGSNYGNYQQTGDGVSGLYLGSFQSELGSTLTAYQKVGAAYDVTESGVASVYAAYFDGVDDCLVSPSIDFTATDKMSVFAGARKVDDTPRMVAELSVNRNTNAGSFFLLSGVDDFQGWGSNASGSPAAPNASLSAGVNLLGPDTAVLTTTHDIPGDLSTIRRNGIAGISGTGDKGTGNFGNYPLYVGQRAATSLPYKGFLSALCTRGAATDATTVTSMEKWLASRTPGVTLPTPPVATYLYADDGTTLLYADDGSTVLTED